VQKRKKRAQAREMKGDQDIAGIQERKMREEKYYLGKMTNIAKEPMNYLLREGIKESRDIGKNYKNRGGGDLKKKENGGKNAAT